MTRDTVKSSFIEKQANRHILRGNVNDAKYNLAPSTLKNNWTMKQREKLEAAKTRTAEIAKNNAPAIGVGLLATTLFLCRKPIAKLIKSKYK